MDQQKPSFACVLPFCLALSFLFFLQFKEHSFLFGHNDYNKMRKNHCGSVSTHMHHEGNITNFGLVGGDKKKPWFEIRGERYRRMNVIPKSSVLVGSGRFLWCPNAKVGTSTLYHLWRNEFNDNLNKGRRCFDSCPLSAWKAFATSEGRTNIAQNTTSFTVVRNPWDRIRSAYEGKISSGQIKPRHSPKDRHLSFFEFVLYIEKYPEEDVHWMSYVKRCYTSPNRDGHMFHYDHIVRLEDFDNGLREVFADAGLEYLSQAKSNQHSNTSLSRMDYYLKATPNQTEFEIAVATIGRVYRDDVLEFGYSFYDKE